MRSLRLVSVLGLGVGLTLAACGGDDDDDADASTTAGGAEQTLTVKATDALSSSPTSSPRPPA